MFEPKDINYKQKVEQSFARQQAVHTMNISITDIRPGEVELQFPYQTELTQQHGFIQAGIIAAVLDNACGYAAFSLMPEEASVLSVEFKVNLLAPAQGDSFLAIGKVKKPGRNITFTEGELFAFQNEQKKLIASMNATIMAIYDRVEVKG